jgi:hypothetical protein
MQFPYFSSNQEVEITCIQVDEGSVIQQDWPTGSPSQVAGLEAFLRWFFC